MNRQDTDVWVAVQQEASCRCRRAVCLTLEASSVMRNRRRVGALLADGTAADAAVGRASTEERGLGGVGRGLERLSRGWILRHAAAEL